MRASLLSIYIRNRSKTFNCFFFNCTFPVGSLCHRYPRDKTVYVLNKVFIYIYINHKYDHVMGGVKNRDESGLTTDTTTVATFFLPSDVHNHYIFQHCISTKYDASYDFQRPIKPTKVQRTF